MSEEEKKHDGCCCCQIWKAIFITLALLIIGAIFGHVLTKHCCMMGGPCGDRGMKACWDRDGAGHHGWWGDKDEMGKHPPGCMCPMCRNRAGGPPTEPNKAGCPMMGKEQGKPPMPEKK